jgi:hypothetical protein
MLFRVAVIGLRAICVFLSVLWAVGITALYIPVLRANSDSVELTHLVPLFLVFFGILVPTSFILRKGRWRETTMTVASFGWAIAMGAWFIALYGYRMREEIMQGHTGHLLNFLAMVLFTANGLLSLRSLRRAASSP